MKRFLYLNSTVVVVSLILSACNAPVGSDVTGDATELPATVTETAVVEASPTLVSIDLAGPPMEIGSKYPYVDGTILVAVPGGTFIMGYQGEDNPVHEVTVSDFWIYSTKVTNSQYGLCVATGKCVPPDQKNNALFGNFSHANYPVTGVTYEQASQYCSFVNGKLPTEAQWEKAARGPEGNIFPWGDEAPTCSLSNYLSCIGNITPINEYTNGVSFYSAFDMAGNAREWVLDWYSPSYYTQSPAEDPLGPELGEKRSVRGSSFQDGTDSAISAHRFSLNPTENLPDLGFRCVVGDPTFFAPMCEQLGYIGIGPNGEEANCTPDMQCNNVSISQAPVCTQRLEPYTIVTFNLADNPPDGWVYDVPGCSQISGEDKFVCNPPGPFIASAEGSCEGSNTCEASCPVNYINEDGVCKWNGEGSIGTECIAGTTYDPLTQCCSATPGSVVDYKLCPAGYYVSDGVCYSDQSYTQDTESLNVLFNSCEPPKETGGGGGPTPVGGCPVQSCTTGNKWCQASCSCIYQYSTC
ncbi:MAG: SUMF1/EgtB/PvdO family nonheme iron enzyme [Anaerolineales bacterium]|nr:SUMF1/EgtB/PvdO family nonheme iron enzyme [Anaerolineales bacterium]